MVVIRDNKDIVKLYPNSLYFVNKSVYISTFADYNVENRNKAEKILNCSIEKFLDGEKCKEFSIFEYPELSSHILLSIYPFQDCRLLSFVR